MNKISEEKKIRKRVKHKAKKRNMSIVICGMVVESPKCDDCNYCECETCPTWHGMEATNE